MLTCTVAAVVLLAGAAFSHAALELTLNGICAAPDALVTCTGCAAGAAEPVCHVKFRLVLSKLTFPPTEPALMTSETGTSCVPPPALRTILPP